MITVLHWLWKNLASLLISFILALVVWVSAVTSTNPTGTDIYSQIPLTKENLDSNVVLTSQVPSTVTAWIEAPQSIQQQLRSDPSSITAQINLAGLGPGDHIVPVNVKSSFNPTRVVQVEPAEIHLTLEQVLTRTFTVTLEVEGQPAPGYQVGNASYNPNKATVSGPAPLVKQIQQVQTALNVTNASQTINKTLTLEALDDKGQPVNGVTITPAAVDVTQPINLLGGYRNVIVRVIIDGKPAPGYKLTNIVVTPPNVIVFSSDPQKLNDLPGYVETKPINIDGAQDNIETFVDLNLPTGVSVVNSQRVLVQLSVDTVQSDIAITLPIDVTGLAPGLRATVDPANAQVILSGPVPVLNTLTSADLRLSVDLTGKTTGSYQIVPSLGFVPGTVQIQSITPSPVTVHVSDAPTPTPIPTAAPTETPKIGP